MCALSLPEDHDAIEGEIRARRRLIDQSAHAFIALADRLDDEIAALEAARRLQNPAPDVDFESLLDEAERAHSER